MPSITLASGSTWVICVMATAGVILRPWGLPEGVWAVAAAVLLVLSSLLPLGEALAAVASGLDVYLFLAGMMLLAELASLEGLFDWLAALAAAWARGSARRLFALVYVVGVVVTTFLSNDATAVVLTPAVYAATRAARVQPLPYLYICAFVANAASFVLPISNPANLVVFGSHLPRLGAWLGQFALPSLVSVVVTYGVLRVSQRAALAQPMATEVAVPVLSRSGRVTAYGIVLTAAVLMAASAMDRQLGLPTFCAGTLTALIVLANKRASPWRLLRGVSWGVLPLVAGLFVLVQALARTGVLALFGTLLKSQVAHSAAVVVCVSALVVAVACNLMNNLPVGLIVGSTTAMLLPRTLTGALLIAVDLGPNLSVTGSLATILWLVALRRQGLHVDARDFLRLGAIAMPLALLLTVLALLWSA